MAPVVVIATHTTSSSPRPHILYNIQVFSGGKETVVSRRYSEVRYIHNAIPWLLHKQFIQNPQFEALHSKSPWIRIYLHSYTRRGSEWPVRTSTETSFNDVFHPFCLDWWCFNCWTQGRIGGVSFQSTFDPRSRELPYLGSVSYSKYC